MTLPNLSVRLPVIGLIGLAVNQLVNKDFSGLANTVLSIAGLLGIHVANNQKVNQIEQKQQVFFKSFSK